MSGLERVPPRRANRSSGLNSCSRLGGHHDAVNTQATALLLLFRAYAGMLVHACPPPVLGTGRQARLDRIEVEVLDLLAVFFHGAQGTVEKARLPQLARFGAPAVDQNHRAGLDGFHYQG